MASKITVGFGITSYNRPEMLKKCLDSLYQYLEFNKYAIDIYVARDTDEDRQGICKRKNECLRYLKHCDYIILLDDDVEVINYGMIDFFLKYNYPGQTTHFLYLIDRLHGKTTHHLNNAYIYNNCGGVFMFLNKYHIEKVGAFNEKFSIYGFEHAEYSQRISMAGFNHSPYMCLNGTDQYLFAHDYSTPNHKSSITDEEKQKHIKENWDKFFNTEITQIHIPL